MASGHWQKHKGFEYWIESKKQARSLIYHLQGRWCNMPKKIQVSKGSLLRGHQIPLHANTWELHHLPSSKIYGYQISNFVMLFFQSADIPYVALPFFFIEWTFMVAVSWGRKTPHAFVPWVQVLHHPGIAFSDRKRLFSTQLAAAVCIFPCALTWSNLRSLKKQTKTRGLAIKRSKKPMWYWMFYLVEKGKKWPETGDLDAFDV